MKLFLIALSLTLILCDAHPDHSHRIIQSQEEEGHHIRDHQEIDHQRSSQNGNVRTRNGEKHNDELRALVDESHVRGQDWNGEEDLIIDRLGSSEDDEPRYGGDGHHEREHEEEDHELFQDKNGNDVISALEQEEQSDFDEIENVEEEETVSRNHEDRVDQDHDRQQQEEDEMEEISDRTHDEHKDTEREDVVDDETIERATGEHEHDAATGEHEHEGADTEDMDEVDEKPELEYAGQGQGDERARGTFDRDESVEGRHDVFESPQEVHQEPDHDDNRNEEEKTWDEIEREMEQQDDDEDETQITDDEESVGPSGEPTMEPTMDMAEDDESEPETENLNGFLEDYIHGRNHGGFHSDDALVANINENRDLENNHEQKNSAHTEEDVEHQREEVDGEEKPELEYAGQGTADERARGTFDRDENVEGRHDVFESPQEIHEEPDHDDNRIEEENEEETDTQIADDEGTVGPTGEPTMEPTMDMMEEIAMDDNEERELAVVHNGVGTVIGDHWFMSVVLLILTGTAMTVLFIHLLRKRSNSNVKSVDPECTPLIADKV